MIRIIGCLLLLLAAPAWGKTFHSKKDLTAEWQIRVHGDYQRYDGRPASTIYININANGFVGDYLTLQSNKDIACFINGKLAANGKSFRLSIDSLARIYTGALQIGIHGERLNPAGLTTKIESLYAEATTQAVESRKSTSFRDFTIIGALVLISLLVIVIRLNPKLASDYFSVRKIFSIYETEDSQVYSRMTSSTNILFYVFCSLMLAYYLMIIFQFVAGRYPFASTFHPGTFVGAILTWLNFSLVLLLLFFGKIVLVFSMTRLFGLHGVAGSHFFNWIRVILVIFGVATIVLSFYFIGRGQNEKFFAVLFQFLSWTLVGWMILILLKLRGRSEHTLFHLFSYICATELIPFLFIIKILYN